MSKANTTTRNKILKLNSRKLLFGATCILVRKLQKVPPPPSEVQELNKTNLLSLIRHQPLLLPNRQRKQNAIEKANKAMAKLSKKPKINHKKNLTRPKAKTLLRISKRRQTISKNSPLLWVAFSTLQTPMINWVCLPQKTNLQTNKLHH